MEKKEIEFLERNCFFAGFRGEDDCRYNCPRYWRCTHDMRQAIDTDKTR